MTYEHIKKRFYLIFVSLCLIIIFVGIGEFIYEKIDGVYFNQPISIENNGELKTVKPIYHPGDTVEAMSTFCKNRNASGVFQWQLVNEKTSQLSFYQPQTSSLTKGCYKDVVSIVGVLSLRALPGTYHFNGTIVYKINELTTVVVPLSTNSFKVQ